MMDTSIVRQCRDADLLRAIITVADEAKDPGSDFMWANHRLRRNTTDAVAKRWSELCGEDSGFFPYTTEHIMRCWISWRKMIQAGREAVREELGMVPRKRNLVSRGANVIAPPQ